VSLFAQLKHGNTFRIGVAYAMVTFFCLTLIFMVIAKHTLNDQASSITPAAIEQSLAVLPFTDTSSDTEQEYFSNGISEELLNRLARIRGLQVVGRTSSFSFRNQDVDLRLIGAALNVENILQGRVNRSGNQINISAELVKVADGSHFWSGSLDGDVDDVFVIQERIVTAVVDALLVTPGTNAGELATGGTRNFAAYDAYLDGISLYRQAGQANIARAIEKFEQAVVLDTEFANAWGVLAEAYNSVADFVITERAGEFIGKREAAAARAIAIAPEAVVSLRAAALQGKQSGVRKEAEQELKKALELAPTDVWMNYEYGGLLIEVGRVRESLEYYRRVVRREPLSLWPSAMLGFAYELNGESGAALKERKRAQGLPGDQEDLNSILSVHAMIMEDSDLIQASIEKRFYNNLLPFNIRSINRKMLALVDSPEAARLELQHLYKDTVYNVPLALNAIAIWASYFGDHELALKAYYELSEIGTMLTFVIWRPVHKDMRSKPAFKKLVRALGLEEYWRSTGNWSDFCHPVGTDDFECG